MNTLKLNSKQIQVAIDQLTAQPDGMNKLMEMALNSLMKAEREVYLNAAQSGNKVNGYRAINGFGIGGGVGSASIKRPYGRF